MLRAAAALCLTALLGPCAPSESRAHLGDLSYSDIVVRGDSVAYRLKFAAHLIPGTGPALAGKLTHRDVVVLEPAILAWLSESIELDSQGPCEASLIDLIGPDTNDDLTVVLGYRCKARVESLRIEFHPFDEPMPRYQNVVSIELGEIETGYVFTREHPVLVVGKTENVRDRAVFREFFELGVEHIWGGYDHLLFLLGLFLPGGTLLRCAGIVTAFTIAHSVTLSIAALGIFTLPPAPVEIAVAASIVYVGVAALLGTADRRTIVTFAFGLVHGFAFASVLAEVGLSAGRVFLPLLAFNLGVEAGQLVIVAVAVPALWGAMRGSAEQPVRIGLALLTIAAGVFWMVERIAGLLAG